MNLGKVIRDLREEKGMNQQELSKKSEVTQKTISYMEGGKTKINTETLRRIADGLGVPVAFLIWKATEREDIAEEKRPAYDQLRPSIDALINTFR